MFVWKSHEKTAPFPIVLLLCLCKVLKKQHSFLYGRLFCNQSYLRGPQGWDIKEVGAVGVWEANVETRVGVFKNGLLWTGSPQTSGHSIPAAPVPAHGSHQECGFNHQCHCQTSLIYVATKVPIVAFFSQETHSRDEHVFIEMLRVLSTNAGKYEEFQAICQAGLGMLLTFEKWTMTLQWIVALIFMKLHVLPSTKLSFF